MVVYLGPIKVSCGSAVSVEQSKKMFSGVLTQMVFSGVLTQMVFSGVLTQMVFSGVLTQMVSSGAIVIVKFPIIEHFLIVLWLA